VVKEFTQSDDELVVPQEREIIREEITDDPLSQLQNTTNDIELLQPIIKESKPEDTKVIKTKDLIKTPISNLKVKANIIK